MPHLSTGAEEVTDRGQVAEDVRLVDYVE